MKECREGTVGSPGDKRVIGSVRVRVSQSDGLHDAGKSAGSGMQAALRCGSDSQKSVECTECSSSFYHHHVPAVVDLQSLTCACRIIP